MKTMDKIICFIKGHNYKLRCCGENNCGKPSYLYHTRYLLCLRCGNKELNLLIKENKNNDNLSVKIGPPKPPFSGLHYQG